MSLLQLWTSRTSLSIKKLQSSLINNKIISLPEIFVFLLSFKLLQGVKKRGILKKLTENSPVLQISMSTGNLSILFYVFSISLCIYAHKFCFMLLSCLKMVGIYLFSVQKFTLALIITIFCIEKRPRVKSESILSLINLIF